MPSPRVPLIWPRKKKSVAGALRNRAKRLSGNLERRLQESDRWGLEIPSMLRREIALTLEGIDRTLNLYEKQKERLLKQECYAGTELLQLKESEYRYVLEKPYSKDRLQACLFQIDAERRRLSQTIEEKLQEKHEKLLQLLEKHAQLDF